MNIWPFVSLFAGLSHLSLGIYVLYKNLTRPINITFSLLAFSLAIWSITEFGHRITASPEIASFFLKFSGFGWCFMVSFCLHFTLVFSKRSKLLKNALTYVIIYVPVAIILSLFLTTDLIYYQEPAKRYFGYTSLPGKYVWTYSFFYTLMYIFMMYLFVDVAKKGTVLEKKQAISMSIGFTLFYLLTTLTNVIYPDTQTNVPELGTAFSIIWSISIFYAVLKYRLFEVEPLVEESVNIPKQYTLEKGHGYLIKEKWLDKGYQIFYDQITHDCFGLCITKLVPETIREKYKLIKTPILWSTFRNAENSISPRDLNGLTYIVSDFIGKTENPMLFLDCFDQIKFVNGFDKSILILKELKVFCIMNGLTMLISLNPKMFEGQQLAIIENELEEVGY
ncbi:MAG: hypothetical protein QG641_1063 [Candidatus Poribacteria bacterium]|nr:hypothetical protein [Candidatus Poribacteria bacterium]